MMTLSACETLSSPKLKVSVPDNCERLAHPVPDHVMKIGDSALAALAETRAKLGIANRRLKATQKCVAKVRERFARGG